jgi:hypothetical protein
VSKAKTEKPALTALSQSIASDAAGAGVVGIDPLTILAILMALFQAWQACKKSAAEAVDELQSPGRATRLLTRLECRKHTARKRDADVLVALVLDRGAGLTVAQAADYMAEAE